MPKPEKIDSVKKLTERLRGADAALLAEYRGLRVAELKELRLKLAEGGTEFRVVKNTLTRIAVRNAELEELLPMLEGSTAIAFVKGDPITAAKALDELSKKYPVLSIKGGLVEGRVLDGESARALASIKPRDVLLAEFAGMLQSPIQKLVLLLSAPLRNLGYALAAYRTNLETRPEESQPGTDTTEPSPTEETEKDQKE